MLHEVPRGVGRSSRTPWPRFLGLPARWQMSMPQREFESGPHAPGGLGYCVKPGEDPCLLVSGGGGGGHVIVGGDEVQQGPWSVDGCRAAMPAHAWYVVVIVPDWWHIGLQDVVFGDGPGDMLPLDIAGSLFVAVGC